METPWISDGFSFFKVQNRPSNPWVLHGFDFDIRIPYGLWIRFGFMVLWKMDYGLDLDYDLDPSGPSVCSIYMITHIYSEGGTFATACMRIAIYQYIAQWILKYLAHFNVHSLCLC